jgi:pimeloyl-ACP methyl ester carboxylesterase
MAIETGSSKPTIVLVHGAFADGSSWWGVIERLQAAGHKVVAPANPLRGLSSDSAYIASFLASIEGPIIAVAHSYGGAVITNAAAGNPNVKALVFVAAFAPAPGETAFGLTDRFPGSETSSAIRPVPYMVTDGEGVDAYIDPAQFHAAFAGDVPATVAAVMAASQRPAALATGQEGSVGAAWQTIPSWYIVAKNDKIIPADAHRFMANRAGSMTIEVESSHVVMISHPDEVARVIENAAEAVRGKAAA